MTKKIGLCFGIVVVFALVFGLGRYLSAQQLQGSGQQGFGQQGFGQQQLQPNFPPAGGDRQLVVADLNNDKKKEIIVLDGDRIVVFDHKGKKKFEASLTKK